MIKIFVVFLSALTLIGCATPQVKQSQIQKLQERITILERELLEKDEQIRFLEGRLEQKKFGLRKEEKKVISGITPKRIQMALKNAGFYKGPIDGNIGPQTRQAIKEFQKANGLKGDGIVGRQTWEKLSKHLN